MTMSGEGRAHGEVTERVIGIFYDVYNELGHGFLEIIYEQALAIALGEAGIQFEQQRPISVWFRGQQIGEFRADVIVEGRVLLELKAARAIDEVHGKQLLNYLRATEIEVGLLLNFGLKLQFRRLVYENERKGIRVDPRESVAEKVLT
jgi:GxxExxY protein